MHLQILHVPTFPFTAIFPTNIIVIMGDKIPFKKRQAVKRQSVKDQSASQRDSCSLTTNEPSTTHDNSSLIHKDQSELPNQRSGTSIFVAESKGTNSLPENTRHLDNDKDKWLNRNKRQDVSEHKVLPTEKLVLSQNESLLDEQTFGQKGPNTSLPKITPDFTANMNVFPGNVSFTEHTGIRNVMTFSDDQFPKISFTKLKNTCSVKKGFFGLGQCYCHEKKICQTILNTPSESKSTTNCAPQFPGIESIDSLKSICTETSSLKLQVSSREVSPNKKFTMEESQLTFSDIEDVFLMDEPSIDVSTTEESIFLNDDNISFKDEKDIFKNGMISKVNDRKVLQQSFTEHNILEENILFPKHPVCFCEALLLLNSHEDVRKIQTQLQGGNPDLSQKKSLVLKLSSARYSNLKLLGNENIKVAHETDESTILNVNDVLQVNHRSLIDDKIRLKVLQTDVQSPCCSGSQRPHHLSETKYELGEESLHFRQCISKMAWVNCHSSLPDMVTKLHLARLSELASAAASKNDLLTCHRQTQLQGTRPNDRAVSVSLFDNKSHLTCDKDSNLLKSALPLESCSLKQHPELPDRKNVLMKYKPYLYDVNTLWLMNQHHHEVKNVRKNQQSSHLIPESEKQLHSRLQRPKPSTHITDSLMAKENAALFNVKRSLLTSQDDLQDNILLSHMLEIKCNDLGLLQLANREQIDHVSSLNNSSKKKHLLPEEHSYPSKAVPSENPKKAFQTKQPISNDQHYLSTGKTPLPGTSSSLPEGQPITIADTSSNKTFFNQESETTFSSNSFFDALFEFSADKSSLKTEYAGNMASARNSSLKNPQTKMCKDNSESELEVLKPKTTLKEAQSSDQSVKSLYTSAGSKLSGLNLSEQESKVSLRGLTSDISCLFLKALTQMPRDVFLPDELLHLPSVSSLLQDKQLNLKRSSSSSSRSQKSTDSSSTCSLMKYVPSPRGSPIFVQDKHYLTRTSQLVRETQGTVFEDIIPRIAIKNNVDEHRMENQSTVESKNVIDDNSMKNKHIVGEHNAIKESIVDQYKTKTENIIHGQNVKSENIILRQSAKAEIIDDKNKAENENIVHINCDKNGNIDQHNMNKENSVDQHKMETKKIADEHIVMKQNKIDECNVENESIDYKQTVENKNSFNDKPHVENKNITDDQNVENENRVQKAENSNIVNEHFAKNEIVIDQPSEENAPNVHTLREVQPHQDENIWQAEQTALPDKCMLLKERLSEESSLNSPYSNEAPQTVFLNANFVKNNDSSLSSKKPILFKDHPNLCSDVALFSTDRLNLNNEDNALPHTKPNIQDNRKPWAKNKKQTSILYAEEPDMSDNVFFQPGMLQHDTEIEVQAEAASSKYAFSANSSVLRNQQAYNNLRDETLPLTTHLYFHHDQDLPQRTQLGESYSFSMDATFANRPVDQTSVLYTANESHIDLPIMSDSKIMGTEALAGKNGTNTSCHQKLVKLLREESYSENEIIDEESQSTTFCPGYKHSFIENSSDCVDYDSYFQTNEILPSMEEVPGLNYEATMLGNEGSEVFEDQSHATHYNINASVNSMTHLFGNPIFSQYFQKVNETIPFAEDQFKVSDVSSEILTPAVEISIHNALLPGEDMSNENYFQVQDWEAASFCERSELQQQQQHAHTMLEQTTWTKQQPKSMDASYLLLEEEPNFVVGINLSEEPPEVIDGKILSTKLKTELLEGNVPLSDINGEMMDFSIEESFLQNHHELHYEENGDDESDVLLNCDINGDVMDFAVEESFLQNHPELHYEENSDDENDALLNCKLQNSDNQSLPPYPDESSSPPKLSYDFSDECSLMKYKPDAPRRHFLPVYCSGLPASSNMLTRYEAPLADNQSWFLNYKRKYSRYKK